MQLRKQTSRVSSFLNLLKKLKVTSINRKIKSVVRYQRFLISRAFVRGGRFKKGPARNNIEYDSDVKVVEKQDLYD